GADRRLLVTKTTLAGSHDTAWSRSAQAVFADAPHRPDLQAPRARIHGLQSAVVVGPAGAEIHTDELGRVRVQFAWDRYGSFEDARGRERLSMHAERDFERRVKSDEIAVIGARRAETVGADATETIGANRTVSVGLVDSTVVGTRHAVTVASPTDGPRTAFE